MEENKVSKLLSIEKNVQMSFAELWQYKIFVVFTVKDGTTTTVSFLYQPFYYIGKNTQSTCIKTSFTNSKCKLLKYCSPKCQKVHENTYDHFRYCIDCASWIPSHPMRKNTYLKYLLSIKTATDTVNVNCSNQT